MSPSDAKSKPVGDTVTEVATGGGGVVGAVVLSPHPVRSKTAANAWNLNFSVFLSPRYLMTDNMKCDFNFSLVGCVYGTGVGVG